MLKEERLKEVLKSIEDLRDAHHIAMSISNEFGAKCQEELKPYKEAEKKICDKYESFCAPYAEKMQECNRLIHEIEAGFAQEIARFSVGQEFRSPTGEARKIRKVHLQWRKKEGVMKPVIVYDFPYKNARGHECIESASEETLLERMKEDGDEGGGWYISDNKTFSLKKTTLLVHVRAIAVPFEAKDKDKCYYLGFTSKGHGVVFFSSEKFKEEMLPHKDKERVRKWRLHKSGRHYHSITKAPLPDEGRLTKNQRAVNEYIQIFLVVDRREVKKRLTEYLV